ncbi:MAG: ExeM/NucH family extracellular endonuclease [Chloroflexota bacterium]
MKKLLRMVWVLPILMLGVFAIQAQTTTQVFVNEFHYDNDGTDEGEFIEIAATAGIDLTGYSVVLYNGSSSQRSPYDTIDLTGETVTDECAGLGFIVLDFPANGIQNGAPDGIAVVDANDAVLEFISYEGSFEAASGPAVGLTSTDIGVSESSSTPVGFSLQRSGAIGDIGAFQTEQAETKGAVNTGQDCDGGTPPPANVRINEFHYDNTGGDEGEFVEIAAVAGTNLDDYQLVFYNGNGGSSYATVDLAGVVADQCNGWGFVVVDQSGIQNGSPDGIALVNDGTLVEFLSYEGTFTADGGPADGVESTDVGVTEPNDTPIGFSLQLAGDLSTGNGLVWQDAQAETRGAVNANQTVAGDACDTPPPADTSVRINEFHYDNDGGDEGEFVEIAAVAGTNLDGYSLTFYNGNGGSSYATVALSGIVADQCNGWGFVVVDQSGIQNGAPDGIALDNDGVLIEFLSYEGTFIAVGGPADGVESTDVGVSEGSSTPIGFSLQLAGDLDTGVGLVWQSAQAETRGAVNTNQTVDGDDCDVPPPTELVKIHEVQGSGDTTPLDGTTVIIEAVVVGDFQNGDADDSQNLGGFYVQEELADQDADPLTSEGLFIDEFQFTAPDVNVGDVVRITGEASERFGQTRLAFLDSLEIIGTATLNVDYAPALISAPVAGGDYEQYEGMLVTFTAPLTLTELFNLDRFGEARASFDGRLFQYTNTNTPDATGFAAYQEEVAARSVLLDDGLDGQNNDPLFAPAGQNNPFDTNTDEYRMGAELQNLTGVVRFAFSEYRIASPTATYVDANPRVDAPVVDGNLRVASFNVLNFFTTIDENGNLCGPSNIGCRGADSQAEFDRQLAKTLTALIELDADIVGLVEVENNPAASPAGDGVDPVLEALVDALNAELANQGSSRVYDFVDAGVISTDAIKVGFIYDITTVGIADGTSPAVLDDSLAGTVGFTAPLFDGENTNRAPLAVTFEDLSTGGEVTIVNNHYKSKGGTGSGADADQNDGAGNWNDTRTRASQAILSWLDTNPTGSDDEDIMLIGDFNAYLEETPITTLEANGFSNVLDVFVSGQPYSFVFDGQAGALDHGFVSTSMLLQTDGAAEWHVNADEPDLIDYNLDFGTDLRLQLFDATIPERASDHDPLVIGITLNAENDAPVITEIADQEIAEGLTLFLDVTITDADGDELTVTSSAGTIERFGSTDIYQLSIPTVDNLPEPITVTIFADDGKADVVSESFELTIFNVAPTADLVRLETPQDRPVFVGTSASVAFSNVQDSSPVDQESLVLDVQCGNGIQGTEFVANGYICDYTAIQMVDLVGTVSDKDGGASSYTISLNVISSYDAIDYIRSVITDELDLRRVQEFILVQRLNNLEADLRNNDFAGAFDEIIGFVNRVYFLTATGQLSNADGSRLVGLAIELVESVIFSAQNGLLN